MIKAAKGNRWTFAMDLETRYGMSLRYGAEFSVQNGFSARLGLVDWNPSLTLRDKSPSLGFGLAILVFDLDYGLMVSEAGLFHHVSLLVRFPGLKQHRIAR